MIFELLAADQPCKDSHPDPQSKFWGWSEKLGADEKQFPKNKSKKQRTLNWRCGWTRTPCCGGTSSPTWAGAVVIKLSYILKLKFQIQGSGYF